MTTSWTFGIVLALCACVTLAAHSPASPAASEETNRIRQAAVAGLFYPADARELGRQLDALLAAAKPSAITGLRALVCPHAGYGYSGLTAAHAYKLLAGSSFQKVIILAPSHYALFSGASVSGASEFRTPLGSVPVDPLAGSLAAVKPMIPEAPCSVQRPSWSAQSSRPIPAPGEATPHTWEHAAEVQVPFLQRVLRAPRLVPIILGEVDPLELAKALSPHVDAQTLVVASSDLSHYHSYEQAHKLDSNCVDALCRLDVQAMQKQEACGRLPILTLMHLAREKGWKASLLDQRNSGDAGGDKNGVVGYAAVAFHDASAAPPPAKLGKAERRRLLDLARAAVQELVLNRRTLEAEPADFSGALSESCGCFVTLTEEDALRGCIGNLQARGPLYKSVIDNACSAAAHDPRFPPVRSDELHRLAFEISVLTVPRLLSFQSPEELLAALRPHVDGVVLQIGSSSATYLPQVWEQLPDKEAFLNHLAQKAGCAPQDWRKPGTRVSIYQVEAFKDEGRPKTP